MRETDLTDSQKAVLLVIATDAACDIETLACGILESELKTRPIVRILILAGLVHKSKTKGRVSYDLTYAGNGMVMGWLVGNTLAEFEKVSRQDVTRAIMKPFTPAPKIPPLP